MALKLIPPGRRKNFMVRGWLNGKLHEYSTGTADPRLARRIAKDIEQRIAGAGPQQPGKVTFAEAARRYVEFRNPSVVDRQRLEKVVNALGSRRLREITVADLHEMANRLGAGTSAATRNRNYLRPAITVMHYASNAGLAPYLRAKTFKEPRPRTRALDRETSGALIDACDDPTKRLLVTWLFCQGTRISDTLRVKWDDIDLDKGTVRIHVSKTDSAHVFPLHAGVRALLDREPLDARRGYVFPWHSRSSVRWLRELGEQVGVKFTAHMARHSLATWLAQDGAALRTIMDALGHADVHSSMRYQGSDVETVRAAINKVGRIA